MAYDGCVHGMCVDLQQHDAISGIADYHVDLHKNVYSTVWEVCFLSVVFLDLIMKCLIFYKIILSNSAE